MHLEGFTNTAYCKSIISGGIQPYNSSIHLKTAKLKTYSSLEWLHKCLQVKNQAKAALPVKSLQMLYIYRSRSKFRLPFGIRIFHAGNI